MLRAQQEQPLIRRTTTSATTIEQEQENHVTRRLLAALRPLTTSVLLAMCAPVAVADNLQEIFDLAVNNDPEIRQARAAFNASHTLLSQGRSYLLPTISGTADTSRDTSGIDGIDPTGRQQPHSFGAGFNSKGYGLSLRQAVLNFQAWYTYKAAQKSDEANALTLAQNEQALIMKVASA